MFLNSALSGRGWISFSCVKKNSPWEFKLRLSLLVDKQNNYLSFPFKQKYFVNVNVRVVLNICISVSQFTFIYSNFTAILQILCPGNECWVLPRVFHHQTRMWLLLTFWVPHWQCEVFAFLQNHHFFSRSCPANKIKYNNIIWYLYMFK